MSTEALISVLMVEDDTKLANLTRTYLEKHGLVVEHARDGERGQELALKHSYDAVLLDIMLPGRSGLDILRSIREHRDVPVIMITARGEEADRVMGLEIGADDYVSKPFSPRELLARIRAVVRRMRGQAGPTNAEVRVSELSLDPGSRKVVLSGEEIDLTSYEFSLLYALVSNAGRVLTRERLMELARGNAEEAFDRSIDVHVSRLRHKLGDNSRKSRMIRTVRGLGYQYLTEADR